MRFCPNCGTPITPGKQACLSCGQSLPLERQIRPQPNQHADTMLSSLPPQKEIQPPPSNTPNASSGAGYTPIIASNTPFAGYQPPQAGSGMSYGPSSGPGSSSTPAAFPVQNGYYGQTPPPPPGIIGPPPTWATTPHIKKKKLSKGLFATLALLTVLIMGSGFWLIYYTTVSHPAQLQTQATATMQARSTTEASIAGTVSAQTTGTAIAQAHTAATAVAQQTAQAQATTTALQNLYTKSTAGTPALDSPLNAQDGANWYVYDAVGGGGCAFSNGSLHASVIQKNYYVPCFALNSNYSNMAFQAQMTIISGSEGGLIFRANQTTSQFYLFRVGQDGSYSLYVSKDDKTSTAIVDDTSTAIKKGLGQTNLVTIIAKGSNIYLYINRQYVGSVSDTSYTGGKIGIFGSNSSNATDVAFNNVQVWPL
jgi:hypothetical protein